ncbi:MAG: hypothetical protein HOW73_07490 [Polyangiaceae bacterium]|nr:hypothetical protein [Polyangiaceae bacterium]
MADARKLWTAGSKAPVEVDMENIVARAEEFRRRVRRGHAREYVAGAFVIVIFVLAATLPMFRLPPLSRVGAALIVCGSVFTLTYMALRATPAEVRHDSATLRAYRAELERRRALLSSVVRWYVAPTWPGIILLVTGIAIHRWGAPGALPILLFTVGFVVAVTVGVVYINRRAAAKLTQELEELPLPAEQP